MKRAFDVFCAVLGLALLWPVAIVVAIAIRRDSPGRIIFSQTRVGRELRAFRCHKFRSMYVDAPERPTHESARSDITPVGSILRRTKIDELPQLINVARGEMSLVGPRPCLPSQTELIAARQARGVYVFRPGVTGLAQVHGIDMSNPARLAEVDAEYARRANLWFDLRLILATLPVVRRVFPAPALGPSRAPQ